LLSTNIALGPSNLLAGPLYVLVHSGEGWPKPLKQKISMAARLINNFFIVSVFGFKRGFGAERFQKAGFVSKAITTMVGLQQEMSK
jgi:hypothetical protein